MILSNRACHQGNQMPANGLLMVAIMRLNGVQVMLRVAQLLRANVSMRET